MSFSVQMPALGESVTEGTVTRWLKQEGDRVEVDEPLLEVSTDKVDTEIPSPAAGVLERIVAAEDDTVEVGGELAVIAEAGADDSGSGGSDDEAPAAEEPADEAPAAEEPAEEEPAEEEPAEDEPVEEEPVEEEPVEEEPVEEEPVEEEPVEEEPAKDSAEEEPGAGEEPAEAPRATTESVDAGTAVTMPELGESVTEGTVTRWLKEVGDSVELDEPLLEISTDKVDTEIPSPVAGTLLEISAAEDDVVPVGGQLAVIGDADASVPEKEEAPQKEAPQEEAPEEAPKDEAPEGSDEEPSTNGAAEAEEKAEPDDAGGGPARPQSDDGSGPEDSGRDGSGPDASDTDTSGAPYVTPLVRKLAAEHDVDLSALSGSGVGGRIRKQDVLAAAEARKPAEPEPAPAAETSAGAPAEPAAAKAAPKPAPSGPEAGTTVKLPRLRQVIAQRMTESLRISAQLTTVQEVDVTRIARLRAMAKADFERREGVKLTYLPFFAKATVEALKAFPQVNASINEETREVTYHGSVHLAIAVDTPRGLLVPVIKNAEDLNIAGIARRIADVAARTRDNKIGPDELSGGTFTITNIGSAGALFDTPIINQPQVAILGTGVISKQPVVIAGADGEDVIAIRSMCFLPLTYDHRLVDGADAGRFVSAIKARLEEGAFEADLGL